MAGIPNLDKRLKEGNDPRYAFKAVVLIDVTDGTYQKLQISGGAVVITQIT
jgi:hypothetical protein